MKKNKQHVICLVAKPVDKKLRVNGLEQLVNMMRQRAFQIEAMQADQKADKAAILEEVGKQRLESEKNGQFYKSCLVEAQDEAPAKVVYMNKFSKIAGEQEAPLRNVLGKLFDELYVVEHNIKLKESATFEYIKYLLGDKFDLLFDVETNINHVDSFMEKRAQMRPSLSKQSNNLIDSLVSQVQADASLYLKG